MEIPLNLTTPIAAIRWVALVLLSAHLAAGFATAGIVLSGGGLTLIEQGGSIAPGNLAASGNAFAKDLLPNIAAHQIAHLNDQQFGNSKSWIGNSDGTFAGISFGATPTSVSSIAFGRDNIASFTDRVAGLYTLQYTTVPNPDKDTPDPSWITIGTLNYGAAVADTNFSFPSARHRFSFNAVQATGIRLLVPSGGLTTGTCIDELEVYPAIVVTTAADELNSPAGTQISLREAVRDCPPGAGIGFAAALSGQTITLSLGTEIAIAKDLTIDASRLPAGLTIDGAGNTRIFYQSGGSVSMLGLTLTRGNGIGVIYSNGYGGAVLLGGGSLIMTRCSMVRNQLFGYDFGGAIYNYGTMTLIQCTLSDNSNGNGGAIYNTGTLTLTQCTLSGNSAISGGAIRNSLGTVTLNQSTLSSNSTPGGGGGAIRNEGTFAITQSTLSGNFASLGGAIYNEKGTLTLTNCIVAGNTAFSGTDIANDFNDDIIIIPSGVNFIGNTADSRLDAGATLLTTLQNGPIRLAPLGHYGGPTQTFALLPGSPARNAATLLEPAITSDQRGLPIVGAPDLGAYEAGTINRFDTWAWETMGSALTFGDDDENDGASNGLEYATRRDPMLADTALAPEFLFNGGGHGFRFRYQKDATDLRYIVQRSTDLGANTAWQEIYRLDTRSGVITENGVTGAENPATGLIDLTDPTTSPCSFWRLLIQRIP
jgi:hypothetical protein